MSKMTELTFCIVIEQFYNIGVGVEVYICNSCIWEAKTGWSNQAQSQSGLQNKTLYSFSQGKQNQLIVSQNQQVYLKSY